MTEDSSQNNDLKEKLPEINDSNVNILRRLIHQQLDEIRTGNAFVEHELNPDCFSKLLTDKETFSKFEAMTGKKWMQIETINDTSLNGGKLNKKRKQYVTAIRSESDFVRREIENYTTLASQSGDRDSRMKGRRRKSSGNDDADLLAEDDTISSLSESKVSSRSDSKRKKKKKNKKKKQKEKKHKKKSKKRKRDQHLQQQQDETDDEDDSQESSSSGVDTKTIDEGESKTTAPLTESTASRKNKRKDDLHLEERRQIFEEARDEIMKSIPKEVKEEFREVGFSKWGKEWLPVMFLGPYDVAPGDVRDKWMDMVEKTKKNRTDLARLVFWYGTQEEEMTNAYSFVQSKASVSYEKGVAKGYHKLPSKIQKKVDKGKKLSKTEALVERGLIAINEDAKLPKHKRQPWIFDFEEEYELDDDDDEEMEEGEDEMIEEAPPQPKKKAKKSKKIFQKDDNDDEEEIKDKPITKKKGKKKRKADHEDDDATDMKKKKKKKLSEKSQQKSKQLDDEIEAEVEQEEKFFLEDEIPSEDDKDDDDFSVQIEESDSGDNENDELYEEKTDKQKTKKLKKDKESKTSKKKDESSIDESSKSKPNKSKKKSTQQLLQLEQQKFNQCEAIFIPLMTKLKEGKGVEKQLKILLKEVDKLTPAFIEEYQIGLFVKGVRTEYKDNPMLNRLCKNITQQMKASYHEKKELQPQGFIPKRSKKFQEKTMEEKENTGQHSIPKKNITNQSATKSNEKSTKKIKLESESKIPAPKTFKLMNIMYQQNQPPSILEDSSKIVKREVKKEIVNTTKPEEKKLPTWMFEYPDIEHKIEGDIDRWLSINFLSQAVRYFPHEKNINYLCVARALEDAIYTHLGNSCEEYWDRVHDICGALVGKKKDGHMYENKMGHLARKIIAGEYATPLEVIKIPKKVLLQSYEGHWVA